MSRISYNTTDYPIVTFAFPDKMTLDELDDHAAFFEGLFKERGAFISVADLNAMNYNDITQAHRKRIATSADALANRRAFIAEVVVTASPIARAIFTAYSFVRLRRTHPMKCFATQALALAYARQLLKDRATKTG